MFKKLVSNLPFNPSLLSEVSFYAKRLHQEESIRRAGFIVMAFSMLLQTFAIISPPQSTLANSPSDIVYGATSKSQIVTALKNNKDTLGRTDIANIYSYYGVTLGDIESASDTTVRSRERNYVTTGRSQSPGVDTPVAIPGASTSIYERSLNVWDIKNYENTYPAITGTATGNGILKGKRFWILLKGCGNITFEEIPKTPNLEISKKKITQGDLKPGDTLNYEIYFRNTGNAPAKDVVITDSLPTELEFVSQSTQGPDPTSFSRSGQTLTWKFTNSVKGVSPTSSFQAISISAKVKSIDSDRRVCNSATLAATNHGSLKTVNPESERCSNVKKPVCPGTGLPIPTGGVSKCTLDCPDGSIVSYDKKCPVVTAEEPEPYLTCVELKPTMKLAWNKYLFETRITTQPGAELQSVEYYVDGTLVNTSSTATDAVVDEYEYEFTEGKHTIEAKLIAKSGLVQANNNCRSEIDIEKPPVLKPLPIKSKTVIFTSTNEDANGKTARAGDELAFSITVTNKGDASAPNESFTDDIKDILEYADITDNGGGNYEGLGQTISWDPIDIEPGKSVTHTFKVRVKNPIPVTPVSASDPLSYDNIIDNEFGNRVTIKLPIATSKQVESAVASLPNTGPGTTMLISSMLFMIVGYFFYRSRLMAKELDIIKTEQAAGGV